MVGLAASHLGREWKEPSKGELHWMLMCPPDRGQACSSFVSALHRAVTLPILDVAEHRAPFK